VIRNFLCKGLPLLMVLFFSGCADHIVSECDKTDDKNTTPFPITLAEIQKNLFDHSCAVPGCHSGAASEANLSLTAGLSYKNIVNVSSRQNPDLKIVLPGNSSQNFLIKKLKGENTSVMPPAGKLESALIDSFAAWIDRGALKN